MLRRKARNRGARRIPRFPGLSLSRLIPNVITIGATCAGLTGVRFAFNGEWQYAVLAIFVAGVLDGLDGRMARLLKSASDFGAELDSLSDFVAFGVSPALILYFWSLQELGGFGWAVTLFLAVSCGLRLARFNSNLDKKLPPYAYNYFTGVPAPAGAALALFPMVASFAATSGYVVHPVAVAAWSVIVALLMVSRIPTYSFKKAKIPHGMIVPLLLLALLFIVGLTAEPWTTLSLAMLAYIISFGFSMRSYAHLKAEAERMHGGREDDTDAGDLASPNEPTEPRPVE